MATPKIFVSHSHKDDAFTARLVRDLRDQGANAWMDKTDLHAGNWQQRIDEALADCEWFVLVLTRDALASAWVKQEVYAAIRLKHQGQIRDLIFIQAQSVDHRELPATWGVFNIFDATRDYADALNETLQSVWEASLNISTMSPFAPIPPRLPPPRRVPLARLFCPSCGVELSNSRPYPCPNCGYIYYPPVTPSK